MHARDSAACESPMCTVCNLSVARRVLLTAVSGQHVSVLHLTQSKVVFVKQLCVLQHWILSDSQEYHQEVA